MNQWHGCCICADDQRKRGPIVIDKLNGVLDFHQRMLGLRAERQSLIASNIANADTPHYKARDLDFRSALAAAGGAAAGGAPALARTSPRHLAGTAATPLAAAVRYRGEAQASVDGNTVDLDTERAAFAQNALQYEAGVTFINGVLRTQGLAINGQ